MVDSNPDNSIHTVSAHGTLPKLETLHTRLHDDLQAAYQQLRTIKAVAEHKATGSARFDGPVIGLLSGKVYDPGIDITTRDDPSISDDNAAILFPIIEDYLLLVDDMKKASAPTKKESVDMEAGLIEMLSQHKPEMVEPFEEKKAASQSKLIEMQKDPERVTNAFKAHYAEDKRFTALISAVEEALPYYRAHLMGAPRGSTMQ